MGGTLYNTHTHRNGFLSMPKCSMETTQKFSNTKVYVLYLTDENHSCASRSIQRIEFDRTALIKEVLFFDPLFFTNKNLDSLKTKGMTSGSGRGYEYEIREYSIGQWITKD